MEVHCQSWSAIKILTLCSSSLLPLAVAQVWRWCGVHCKLLSAVELPNPARGKGVGCSPLLHTVGVIILSNMPFSMVLVGVMSEGMVNYHVWKCSFWQCSSREAVENNFGGNDVRDKNNCLLNLRLYCFVSFRTHWESGIVPMPTCWCMSEAVPSMTHYQTSLMTIFQRLWCPDLQRRSKWIMCRLWDCFNFVGPM